jgi:short-subunit dehydrogenase
VELASKTVLLSGATGGLGRAIAAALAGKGATLVLSSLGLREDLWKRGIGVSLVTPGFVREAGMFHDSGTKPPPGFGTTTPEKVAAAVITAIKRNRHEVEVAPVVTRVLSNFAMWRPELAARIAYRRGAGTRIAERVASGQADKR